MTKNKSFFKRKTKNNDHTLKGTILNLFRSKVHINTEQPHRKEAKVINILSYAFQASLLVNFIQMGLLIIILPLKEKVPYFVHFLPKEEQIVYVEPYKKAINQQRQIKEFMARDYVKKRETLDLVSEQERWNTASFWSTETLKNKFNEQYNPEKNPNSPFKIAVDNNMVRLIKIIRSSVLNDNQYQVEFEMTDTNKDTGKIISIKIAVATITFVENNDPFKGDNDLNNPFGWLIDDYSIGVRVQKEENTK